ncbi:MAG: glycosyltransferase family 4 protein [Steroidobacteraceae bacterium]
MLIAYLINEYPKISHSFIRREIHAVERQGFRVMRIALRGWDSELADAADREERLKTRYVLHTGVAPLLWALARTLLATPVRFVRAIAMAIRIGTRAERPLPFHLAYLAEACRILAWLKKSGVSHLHAHFGSNSAEIAMFIHMLGGPPYSFTVHGLDELVSGGITEKLRISAFVVGVSSFGRSQLFLRSDPSLWSKIHVIHCGLEQQFHDIGFVPPPDAPRLVCVGRLCAEKGQMLLIDAAYRLFCEGVAFDLVLAGDGEMRPAIEEHITRLGLNEKIRITGWLSSDEVRTCILNARALVLPSFSEGMPVVIMEAMALRRPVLSTYVSGIPELVLPGENGWLFPAGSVDALVDAMIDCLGKSPDQLQYMGDAAYSRVLSRHSIDIEAQKLVSLFQHSNIPANPS